MDRRRPAISLRRCERSVVVITPRCQRGNPGSNPGARTIYSIDSSEMKTLIIAPIAPIVSIAATTTASMSALLPSQLAETDDSSLTSVI